jgi:ubiquinone/menaquinone biosynthesis C-methylase UbiE
LEEYATDNNSYKEKSKKAFDAAAQNYDGTENGKHSSKLYNTVVSEIGIAHYDSLLDVGCGTGNVLALLPAAKRLCGIDLSDKMIDVAHKRMPEAELCAGDAERLPWDESTFDVVNCTDSFHHYPDPLKVLCGMRRVLKPDGRLIITDPFYPALQRFFINTFAQFGESGDFRVYSRETITELLKQAGFFKICFRALEYKAFIVTAQPAQL